MGKVNRYHSRNHGQVFTCGAACVGTNGYGYTQTSIDKLIAAVRSIAVKRPL